MVGNDFDSQEGDSSTAGMVPSEGSIFDGPTVHQLGTARQRDCEIVVAPGRSEAMAKGSRPTSGTACAEEPIADVVIRTASRYPLGREAMDKLALHDHEYTEALLVLKVCIPTQVERRFRRNVNAIPRMLNALSDGC